jgi:hypothetical protein
LARWLTFVMLALLLLLDIIQTNSFLFSNHPVIQHDGLLSTFLTEPAFEEWRKHNTVSSEEESASKRIDRVEEMTIPSDLEEKLK